MTLPLKILPLDVGWKTCDASPECAGITRGPYGRCMAHLTPAELDEVLGELAPGRGVDLRGTTIGEELLARVLDATERHLGRARFDRAAFTGPARFAGVVFAGDASFDHARFDLLASFFGARFTRNASFRGVRFAHQFSMHEARVRGHGAFDHVHIGSDALFGDARFGRDASFLGAEFHGFAAFDGTMFDGEAIFRGARFHRAVSYRKAVFAGTAGFEGTRFHEAAFLTQVRVGRRLALAGVHASAPLELDTAGCPVDLRAARITGRFTARLADADIDLREAVLAGPATVTRRAGRVRVVSLDRLDAGALTLSGVDLSTCRLGRLRRPEALSLSRCVFAATPRGVRFGLGWPPVRWWTGRRVLADEHVWRGWSAAADQPLDPGRLAGLYERLRRAVDDKRTSADFAFGAMEMRRLASGRRRARLALSAYWLACGYGLRMGRTLGWLALVTAVAAVAVLWPSAAHQPKRPAGGSSEPLPAVHAPTPTAG
ncbi:pentapeptide repeat-containing protein [Sphaerisporangium corydalis]|uniref:Pentapeptide repeat-containing protein n=1 Tax=Sphaerisporangium corydalis TaxID=1441875 RepID=A0ABV9ECW4_9ACTN|nr:pentapeptide repeat-containing protein [Sphaerisporangium corydalis]